MICPRCHTNMLGLETCYACARTWLPLVLCAKPLEPEQPLRLHAGRPIFERCMSNEAVREVRAAIEAGGGLYGMRTRLAEKYHVSPATISRISAGLRRRSA